MTSQKKVSLESLKIMNMIQNYFNIIAYTYRKIIVYWHAKCKRPKHRPRMRLPYPQREKPQAGQMRQPS